MVGAVVCCLKENKVVEQLQMSNWCNATAVLFSCLRVFGTQGASLADKEELMAALEEAQSLSETR